MSVLRCLLDDAFSINCSLVLWAELVGQKIVARGHNRIEPLPESDQLSKPPPPSLFQFNLWRLRLTRPFLSFQDLKGNDQRWPNTPWSNNGSLHPSPYISRWVLSFFPFSPCHSLSRSSTSFPFFSLFLSRPPFLPSCPFPNSQPPSDSLFIPFPSSYLFPVRR